jgi:hypothetical protein
MRTSLLAGLSLALMAAVAVIVSSAFDLQIESVVLLGAAAGAVLALVPDTTPLARFGGALLGIVAALVGFVLRATMLPDSAGGRAVAVAIVVLLCTVVAVASLQRIALWSALLGAAVFAGAYERVYAAAPPELPETSVSTLTALLVSMAVGFLATSWAAPRDTRSPRADQLNDDRPLPDDSGRAADRPTDRPQRSDEGTDLDTLLAGSTSTSTTTTDARMENAR